MKKKIFTVMMTAVIVLGAFAGCSGQKTSDNDGAKQSGNSNLNQAMTLNIGVSQYNFPVIVALEKGFFEEEFGDDVTLNVSLFSSGVTIIEAVSAGDLDFGFWGDFPEITANANNQNIKLYAGETESVGSWANLYVQPDSDIKAIKDLAGHTIAYTVGTNSHKLLVSMLTEAGLTENDVELISLGSKDVATTFVAKSVDACILSARTKLEEGAAVTLATSEPYMGTQVYLGGNDEYARANPDILTRFLQVLQRACDWLNENQEEAAELTAAFDNLDKEAELDYMSTMSYSIQWKDSYVDDLQSTADFSLEQGNVDEAVSVDNLYDDTYVINAGLKK